MPVLVLRSVCRMSMTYVHTMSRTPHLFWPLAFTASSFGQQVIHSVTNGHWHIPEVWDCNCVPSTLDSVYIDHSISIDGAFAKDLGSLEVGVAGQLHSTDFVQLGCQVMNRGTIFCDQLHVAESEAFFENHGDITSARMSIHRTGFYTNGYLDIYDTAHVHVNVLIGPAGSFTAFDIRGAGSLENFGLCEFLGSIGSFGRIWNHGYLFINSGEPSELDYCYNSGEANIYVVDIDTLENFATFRASDLHISAAYSGTGVLLLGGDLLIGPDALGTVSAPGSVEILDGDLVVNGTLVGDGCVMVADSTLNHGNIGGTLRICDLTPTGVGFDVNTGTIFPGVTFCSEGGCSVGIKPPRTSSDIMVVQNPASDQITIRGIETANPLIDILTADGRIVPIKGLRRAADLVIPAMDLTNGICTVRIRAGDEMTLLRVMVMH